MCVVLAAAAARRPMRYSFLATAFSREGITCAGTATHRGMVAADPSVLPIGTVIRVRSAGAYSGVYIVTDTGAKVDGKHIDLYVPNRAAAVRFGKRRVLVRVLHWGAGKVARVSRTSRHPVLAAASR
jgi:rare lipoprotein A